MKRKINIIINDKIKMSCEKIPQEKRKAVVIVLCFLFVAFFVFILVDAFNYEGVKEMMKIEHITPLDLPQDTLVNHLKNLIHGK